MARNAQLENEIRADRCLGGMIKGVKHGRYMWPAPRGYINGRDINHKRNIALKPDEKYVETIRSAWQLVDNGLSCAEAMQNSKQALSGTWTKRTIHEAVIL